MEDILQVLLNYEEWMKYINEVLYYALEAGTEADSSCLLRPLCADKQEAGS